MLTPIHWIGIALLVGGALVFLWPKIMSALKSVQASRAETSPPSEPYYRPLPIPGDVQRTLTPEEKAANEAQDAFKKLKDLEAYFSRVGSTDGLQYICKAGECMFKPPVVSKLAEVKAQPTEFGQSPNA